MADEASILDVDAFILVVFLFDVDAGDLSKLLFCKVAESVDNVVRGLEYFSSREI
jgi:hypothetical protein